MMIPRHSLTYFALFASAVVEANRLTSKPIEFSLWTTPNDPVGAAFIAEFADAIPALGSRVQFTPHMFIQEGLVLGCRDEIEPQPEICRHQCSNAGRYCSDTEFSIYESLSRTCICQVEQPVESNGLRWWHYVAEYTETCQEVPDDTNRKLCAQGLLGSLGVDKDSVQECIEESGELRASDHSNAVLEDLIQAQNRARVDQTELPLVMVNGERVPGTLILQTVLSALCQEFGKNQGQEPPDICVSCLQCPDAHECILKGGQCIEVDASVALDSARIKSAGADSVSSHESASASPAHSNDVSSEGGVILSSTDYGSVGSSKSRSVSSEGGASANASSYDTDPGNSTDGTSFEPLDSGNPISREDSVSGDSDGSVDSSDHASGDLSSSSPSMRSEDSAKEDDVQTKSGNEVSLTVDGKETIFSILYNKLDGQVVCGADMGGWVESVARFALEKDGASIIDLLEDASAQQEGRCSESDSIDFAIALEEFTSCSGLDLRNLIENLPGIKLQTLVRCANFFSVLDGSWSHSRHEECIPIVLGDDPLGKAIRSFYLHPDKNCPCLQSFSKYVPECVLDVHPLPLVGDWMKKAACFLSSLSCGDFLETSCFHELEGLDMCLPMEENDSSCDETLSCRFKEDLFSLSLPKSILGIPLPDACKRIFKQREKSALRNTNILDRYAQFQKQCTSNEEIWDSKDESPAVATINDMDDKNESTGARFESSSQGLFSALAAMMLVAGGGAGALVVYRRQRIENNWARPEGYQVIELT